MDEVILGREWLQANNAVWDFATNRITVNGRTVELQLKQGSGPRCKRCRVSSDVVIAPCSEAIIPANLTFGHFRAHEAAEHWTTVPSEPAPGLHVARTLIAHGVPTVAVRVCNVTKHPVRLHEGQSIGHLQQVSSCAEEQTPSGSGPSLATEQRQDILERVDPSLSADSRAELHQLLDDYQDIFSYGEYDLGHTAVVEHRIDTNNNQPFRQQLRPQPRAYLPTIDRLVNEMQAQGIIEPCHSEWASNIVLVKKKDGNIRFCVDYRKLNSLTQKDAYPLPRIEACLDSLSGAAWYSTFDLRSGFHQVAVHPQDRNKTTFVCHRGTFRFPRMPFGLCNAPATFQRLMDTVLAGMNYETCLVYLDDIIVFSHDEHSHLRRLAQLFQRLRDARLKLKPSKCCVLQKRVNFLGYTVSQAGVGTDQAKIEAVRDWPTPTNLRQCRAFVGLCQYYRRFVPNFSDVAAPLHALTKKGVRFVWSNDCRDAFEDLKRALVSADVLALPNDHDHFILDCDASNKAMGAVLSQIQQGVERPICYASQLFDRHQQNYSVTRKELLAMVTFVKKFRQYLLGRPFTVRTDHAALQWLRRTPEPIGQQARWLEILEEFNFDVEHRPGTKHGNADALSRIRDGAQDDPGEVGPVRVSATTRTGQQAPTTAASSPVPDTLTNDAAEPPSWPQLQQADSHLGVIYRLISDGSIRPQPEVSSAWSDESKALLAQLELLRVLPNGTLVRRWQRHGQHHDQVVVPAGHRQAIADQLHRGLNGGHLGLRRSKLRLQQRFYWPGWSRAVHHAQLRCERCARAKRPPNTRHGQLQPLLTGAPWERIGIDITGPHPPSARGNVYVLTIIDHFTKWVELFPMRNQEAHTVAKILVDQVICRHGCPLQILSDQGPNFESALFRGICERLSIDKVRTTAYKPSTNGNIERFHATMNSMLTRLVSENQRDWDDRLPVVAFAYRTSAHEVTGLTPFYMLHGREARIPADLCYDVPAVFSSPTTPIDFVAQQETKFAEAYALARDCLGVTATRRKTSYDLRCRPATFPVGSRVWYWLPRRRTNRYRKWESHYTGPYEVTRLIGPVNVELRLSLRHRPFVVHIDKLKPYYEERNDGETSDTTLAVEGTVVSTPGAAHAEVRPKRTIRPPLRFR